MSEPKAVLSQTEKPQLKRAKVPREAEQPHAKPRFTPGELLGEETARKNLAYGITIAALALCIVALCWMQSATTRDRMIMTLDHAGTVHIGPLERVRGESTIFRDLALWSTQVALQRSPVGFNMVEYVPMFFRGGAVAKLNADLKDQLPDIQAKNLRQYPEIRKYKYQREGTIQAGPAKGTKVQFLTVEGDLIRSGYYQGIAISESVPFRFVIAAVENPNLTERDQYPYMVEDFRIIQNPTSGQQVETQ